MHEIAIEIMNKLDSKYNMNNALSLDEYICEYYNILNNNEINAINNLLEMFHEMPIDEIYTN
jgi:1-aminocyclopropane-1-carboxylate deaminase/D-cysteine desulfhydrase-like pyridoxal-dependent ACC family enzyme